MASEAAAPEDLYGTDAAAAATEGLRGSGPEGVLCSMAMAEEFVDDSVSDVVPRWEQYDDEIAALVRFFDEEEGLHVVVRHRKDKDSPVNIQRKKIAFLLEGSRLPFSALVKDIFEKLSEENDLDQSKSGAVTMALVKSNVLSLGERLSFGITNPDADILEDDTPRSLWCWEIRDVKALPKPYREEVMDRRRCRRKISDRIAAVSATVDALRSAPESAEHLTSRLEALSKVDDESAIRAAKAMIQQKRELGTPLSQPQNPLGEQGNNLTAPEPSSSKRRRSDPEEKERLRQEKLQKRQQVESEKEQKRKEKEEADRKKQQQKQHDEAEKEQRRKEKEEGERKKQEKKLQDEAEKEQKREAERKKQLALKKQASFMDRFLVKKDPTKDHPPASAQTQQQSEAQPTSSSSPVAELKNRESVFPSDQAAETPADVVTRMDTELKACPDVRDSEELLRTHVTNWLSIRNLSAPRKPPRWGVRRKPKVSVYRELRLNGALGEALRNSLEDAHGRNSSPPEGHLKRAPEEFESSEDVDWKENNNNAVECLNPNSPLLEEGKKPSLASRYQQLRTKRRKLLQFDKSHRPPYYGTFSKRSEHVKPRHPLKQDPALDYEVDSDEEWEEEDPGESLSDAEKDEEDEKVEIDEIEDDEDGPDEFVVPDGYLSENEGVAMEDCERGCVAPSAGGGPCDSQSPVTPAQQSVMSLERLRKVLDNATEHAIRSNHPLVISNLGQLPGCEEATQSVQFPSNRTETLCLEALRMRVLVPNVLIGAC